MRNRRYLALFFPWLPTDRLRLTRPHLFVGRDEHRPFALVEKVGGALRLTAVDETAAALGLAPGVTMANARAGVPDLDLFDHDARADQDWLERLADGCTRYTPTVALDCPHGLVLDTTGSDHLFGGETALAADLERRLARRGIVLRHAYAGTPEGARALARHAAGPAPDEAAAIRRLPVAALELADDATTALHRAGFRTIGDVARRPSSTIAARFGEQAVTILRRILGEAEGAIVPRRVAEDIAVERRFAEPLARTETALAMLEDLAGQAVARLEEASLGGRSFAALFFRTDGVVRRLTIETGRPSRDVAALMRLFRERIDALSDPIDPGFGFDLIRLHVLLAEPLDAAQLILEGGAVAEEEVTALVDRLSTRLGRGRVRRFAPCDTHIPEQAELSFPALEAVAPGAWPAPEPGEPPLRPIHLFDPPHPIEVMADVPDGPPHRFRWRRTLHEVARFEGPERIAGNWWRRRPTAARDGDAGRPRIALGDEPNRTRDYYRVEDRRGRRYWIFRLGFYEGGAASPGWYLHGLFA